MVRQRKSLWFDVGGLALLCAIHSAAWLSLDLADISRRYGAQETASRLRETASGGLTVVSFLLPLTVLSVQLKGAAHEDDAAATSALVDLWIACIWLLASVFFALYVIYFSAFTGYTETIFTHRDIGMAFGFQLFFMFFGLIRVVMGVTSMVTAGPLSREPGAE
jgi:hypothetical protein